MMEKTLTLISVLIDVIRLYSDNISVHLDASKERLLEEYTKKIEIEEMSCARVTLPLGASTSAAPPPAQPALQNIYIAYPDTSQ